MIVVAHPSPEQILRLQDREGRFYFSIGAESVLRRQGLISVRSATADGVARSDGQSSLSILTRAVPVAGEWLKSRAPGTTALEGPVASETLEQLGLTAAVKEVESVGLRSRRGELFSVRRPTVRVGPKGQTVDVPSRWASPAIQVQLFDGSFEDVLFEMSLPDGRRAPAVFRHRGVWISALPIFDLIVEHFAFPPLYERYNTRVRSSRLSELADEIVSDLGAFFAAAGRILVFVDRWPAAYRSAFSIRHDYDRPISAESLTSLLSLYDRLGLKCSMGFLAYSTPADQIDQLVRAGHEVQLHAHEANLESFKSNLAALRKLTGVDIHGATIHGGATSIGFRGDIHFDWFERADLRYAESFSVDNYPSPIYRPDPLGIMRRSPLMASMMHNSMDASTQPKDHRLDQMKERAARGLSADHAVLAMNHPDLNRDEWIEFLQALSLDGVWCATTSEITEWERAKHDVAVTSDGANVTLAYPAPLPGAARLRILHPDGAQRTVVVPAGTRDIRIPLDGSEPDVIARQDERTTPPAPTGERRRFRKAIGAGIRQLRRHGGRARARAMAFATDLFSTIDASIWSRTPATVAADTVRASVRPREQVLLQGADRSAGQVDFLSVVLNPQDRPRQRVVLGASILNELHPAVSGALGCLAGKLETTKGGVIDGRSNGRLVLHGQSTAAMWLADWLQIWTGNAQKGVSGVGLDELSYFIGSTGYRARAAEQVLGALGIAKIETLVDHGSSTGLMPWLLATNRPPAKVTLVERSARYEEPMRSLWSHHRDTLVDWPLSASEDFEYSQGADLIFFCHMLFGLARDDRKRVLDRAWHALNPGGFILVNEIVTDRAPATPPEPDVMQLDTLIEMMTWDDPPKLFRSAFGWSEAEPPLSVFAKDYASTSFVAAQKAV